MFSNTNLKTIIKFANTHPQPITSSSIHATLLQYKPFLVSLKQPTTTIAITNYDEESLGVQTKHSMEYKNIINKYRTHSLKQF